MGDRISIGVTLVLTIVLLQGSLNTNMPKVSYTYLDPVHMMPAEFENGNEILTFRGCVHTIPA